MGAMKQLLHDAAELDAVARLAVHAGKHPDPLPVIANGGAEHDCGDCSSLWLAAWLAVTDYLAAESGRIGSDDDEGEHAHYAAVILSENADMIAAVHGLTVCDDCDHVYESYCPRCGCDSLSLRPFDSEHVRDRKRAGRWIVGESPDGVRVIEFSTHHDRERRQYVATLTPLTIQDRGNGFTMSQWSSNDAGVRVMTRPCPRYSDKGLDAFRAAALAFLTDNADAPALRALLDRAAVVE